MGAPLLPACELDCHWIQCLRPATLLPKRFLHSVPLAEPQPSRLLMSQLLSRDFLGFPDLEPPTSFPGSLQSFILTAKAGSLIVALCQRTARHIRLGDGGGNTSPACPYASQDNGTCCTRISLCRTFLAVQPTPSPLHGPRQGWR